MRVDELEDALRSAADRQPAVVADLDAVRAGGQRRRRQQTRARVASVLGVVVLAVAAISITSVVIDDAGEESEVRVGGDGDGNGDGGPPSPGVGHWAPLPAPPLSPRSNVVGVWTGSEVLFVGGDEYLCPPGADCDRDPDPPLSDGAILDVDTTTWRSIAPSPIPFAYAATAVLDGDVYFLVGDHLGTGQETVLLTYSIAEDRWQELPAPPGGSGLTRLVATDRAVVAFAGSDERGEVADQVYDPPSGTWSPLPDDPRSPSYDRSLVWSAPHLYLFEKALVPNPGSAEPNLVRVSRLHVDTGEWEPLPDSEILDSWTWLVDGERIVNPTLGGADGGEVNGWGRTHPYGGIYDIAAGAWQPLPPAPPEATSIGVLGADDGFVVGAGAGLLLDLTTMSWRAVPAAPGVGFDPYLDRIVVAAGRDVVAFGGQLWASSRGELLGDAWIWRSG